MLKLKEMKNQDGTSWLNKPPKKDLIKKQEKILTWIKCMHPKDNRIAQCHTCEFFVRYPQSIKEYFNIIPERNSGYFNKESYILHSSIIMANDVGQFGHIISENNGGEPVADNLVIQCRSCNSRLGSKNMTTDDHADTIMVDDNIFTKFDDNWRFINKNNK